MKKLLFIIFIVSVAFTLTAADTVKTVKNDNHRSSCCGKMDKSKCSKMMKDGKMMKSGHMKNMKMGHMKNMKHGNMNMMKGSMFPGYMSIQKALATDDAVAAKEGFTNLWKNSEGDVKVLAEKGMKSKDLKGMRNNFKELSSKMAMMKHPDGYATAYCPMAKAWWVQKDGKINNPYFGKKMPHCGSFKKYKKGSGHSMDHKM